MAENNIKTIDENQMINEFDKKSIEKWDEIESLSINNQLLRNKFNFDQQISDSNEKLSKTSIYKLERIDANLRILQNDCNKIIHFKDFDQNQFNGIANQIKELNNNLQIINEFKANNGIKCDNLSKKYLKNINEDENKLQKEFNVLTQECYQLEKEIALMDVFLHENGSEQQLLQNELKLKSDIEEVKRKNKELEKETMALKCLKMTLMSDISLKSTNVSHHI